VFVVTLLYRFIIFGLLGIGWVMPLYAQEAELVLDERLVLGKGGDDSNAMFGDPVLLREDGAGRIYVFDNLAMQIKVYDHRGRSVGPLGRRGREPGAFNSLSTGLITKTHEVLVFDQFNRRITRLNVDGDVIDTTALDRGILWPRDVLSHGDKYLLLYRREDDPFLVHEWDASFATRHDAFARVEAVTGDDPFLSYLTYIVPGHAAPWNDRLVIAPPVCVGDIFQYEPESGTLLAERLSVRSYRSPPFEPVSAESRDELPDNAAVVSGPDGRRAARVFCWSIGLVALPGGYLAHFSARQKESGKVIVTELFNRTGQRVGSHQITQFAAPGDQSRYVPIQIFSGADGDLLVIDRREQYPIVRVFDASVRSR
jgi:hypothetical protein